MEAGTKERELSGEKASRIVDAMRSCVAERGVSGATFEHVAREAGVSRGLLHYYFGTKERLLIEVVRRDSELRIARLQAPLAAAGSIDGVIDILLASLDDLISNDPGLVVLLFDLFTEGRRNPDIADELADLFTASRAHVAEVLESKDREGVIDLQTDADSVVSFLFGLADGLALQALCDPKRDLTGTLKAATTAARHLLGG